MVGGIKLISLNIEGHKHLERVVQFLKSEQPDVICLQEVIEPDFEFIRAAVGPEGVFAPLVLMPLGGPYVENAEKFPWGVLLLSRLPLLETRTMLYAENSKALQEYDPVTKDQARFNRLLLVGAIEHEGQRFTIATTHLTWTPDGNPDTLQRRDTEAMLRVLGTMPEFVLCGDFNAPRGGEIFAAIAARYKDNIPPHYTSSLDPELHRTKGSIERMVDGLFTTPHYVAEDVSLQCGVSDHCAMVARIQRAS